MPSSDYGNAVGGGLKLKGAKDAGVKKHKKKAKKPQAQETESTHKQHSEDDSAVQTALAEEENDGDGSGALVKQRDVEEKEFGKTEAQKKHEERRRKRVCLSRRISLCA